MTCQPEDHPIDMAHDFGMNRMVKVTSRSLNGDYWNEKTLTMKGHHLILAYEWPPVLIVIY